MQRFLTFGIRRDDGVAVYLNGREILRDGLPSGPLTPTTFGEMTNKHAEEVFRIHTFDVSQLDLREGAENVIAVEVHQNEPNSSDLAFDLELFADFQLAPPRANMDLNHLQELLGDALPKALIDSISGRE